MIKEADVLGAIYLSARILVGQILENFTYLALSFLPLAPEYVFSIIIILYLYLYTLYVNS